MEVISGVIRENMVFWSVARCNGPREAKSRSGTVFPNPTDDAGLYFLGTFRWVYCWTYFH